MTDKPRKDKHDTPPAHRPAHGAFRRLRVERLLAAGLSMADLEPDQPGLEQTAHRYWRDEQGRWYHLDYDTLRPVYLDMQVIRELLPGFTSMQALVARRRTPPPLNGA